MGDDFPRGGGEENVEQRKGGGPTRGWVTKERRMVKAFYQSTWKKEKKNRPLDVGMETVL